jgi:hypothetical protein
VPAAWLRPVTGQAYTMPHEAILLRWTSAIKDKAEKLFGAADHPDTGYLAKGVVAEGDAFVVAINARRLRDSFPQLEGISQFPFPVEAVFSVGPYAVQINRENLKVVGGGHSHRL